LWCKTGADILQKTIFYCHVFFKINSLYFKANGFSNPRCDRCGRSLNWAYQTILLSPLLYFFLRVILSFKIYIGADLTNEIKNYYLCSNTDHTKDYEGFFEQEVALYILKKDTGFKKWKKDYEKNNSAS